MKGIILIVLFIIGCNSKTLTNCASYEKGVKYFEKHYHGDYMDDGSRDTVIVLLQDAIKSGCKNFDLCYKLYFCYEWNGDFKNAEKYISEAIQIDKKKMLNFFIGKVK